MSLLDSLVEQRILEAEQRGDFADLPGAGKPLALDEDPLVPDEIRVAYRVLKNAGFVPPEVEEFRTLRELEACVASSEDDENRSRGSRTAVASLNGDNTQDAYKIGTKPSQARRNQANANSLEGQECIRAGFYSAVCNLKAPTGARDPP